VNKALRIDYFFMMDSSFSNQQQINGRQHPAIGVALIATGVR